MGLFGTIKAGFESASLTFKEWMGTEYFKAAAGAGVGVALAEFSAGLWSNALNVTGVWHKVVRLVSKLVTSGVIYYGALKFPVIKDIGISASVGAAASIVIDFIQAFWNYKATGEALGRSLRAWVAGARASAGVTRTIVAPKVTKPVITPRPAESTLSPM